MCPRRPDMSPRRANPAGFRERLGKDFRGILKQRDATETPPTQIAGEGATRLLSRFWGGPRHSRLAPLRDSAARALALLAALAALALLAMLVRSLTSRASRSMIARFPFLGCFFEPLVFFSKNATRSTRKPCFLRSGGSKNRAKMTPRMLQKSSSGAGGLRESLRERFWRVLEGPRGSPEAPQERPRSAQERPRRPKMSPRRPNMSPRRPQMTPRRVKMSPRRAKVSSGRSREASGSDLERISDAFSSNALRPRRSQLKPPARARSARARL